MNRFLNCIFKISNFLIQPLVGDDGRLSGMRIIGSAFAIVAIYIGVYGLKHAIEHLPNISMLVGTFLGASGLFWGITRYSNYKSLEFNSKKDKTEE